MISSLSYSQKNTRHPFNIQECYYQSWVAGIKGGGSGTDLHINFQKELPKDLELIKVYFQNRIAIPNKTDSKEYLFSFKGNTNEHPNEENRGEEEKTINSNIKKHPLSIRPKEVVLEYSYKGNTYFFKIKKVKEKEMLAYPSIRTDENDKN
ncbi:hypothetical protein BWK62_00190 [Flavobacterium oreochromis]|nr:hypothetical protein BWG23_00170 [Flavobacterium oreochromis]OWP79694.1 hypothetical protein BWK62_00190 [Flavobacterium oreochromis]POR30772.1 hypothetical protein BWK58_00275 [Flavobacterium columnare]